MYRHVCRGGSSGLFGHWGGGGGIAQSAQLLLFLANRARPPSASGSNYAGLVETLQVNERQELTGENVLGNWVVGWHVMCRLYLGAT